nr:meprin A subunit alpha-like [Pan troglodytes]
MSSSLVFTTSKLHISPATNDTVIWDRPSRVGTYHADCNCFRTIDFGWSGFISHQMLKRRSFLKNDDLIMFVDFEGASLDMLSSKWERCQAMQVHGSVLGMVIRGTAGVIFLTFSIIAILSQRPRK